MKNIARLVTLIILLSPALSYAQNYQPEKINKKAVRQYELAMEKVSDDSETDLRTVIPLIQKALSLDNNYADAYLSLAGIYGQFKYYDSAVYYFEKARAIDAAYFSEYNLPYSINLAGLGRFDEALKAVNTFLENPRLNETSRKAGQYRQRCYQFAVDYAKAHPLGGYQFNPVNMGPEINSEESEYFPSLTIDGKQLVFTRRLNNFNEDFFESWKENDKWTVSRPLPGAINTNQNEGAQHISQDGQMLVYTGCNFEDGLGSCDIYFSIRTKQGWSQPRNIGRPINSEYWDSQPCLSPDKRELYFSSRRPDGFGGSDIYVSRRGADGRWSEPENLGPEINTYGEESCPFIHADNETLFFVSNALPGYGGDDLFMVKRLPDGKWGKPVNLGYPINTIENEGSLTIAADGVTAFYASDRGDSYGALDLYTFTLRPDLRPLKTSWVKGKVFDKKTREGLPSTVELTELSSNRIVSTLQTDEDGNYLVTLPTGKDYAFNVNRKGYLFFSDHFSLTTQDTASYFERDIALQPLENKASLVLKNIFFDVNRYDLKPASEVELDKLVALLRENPTIKIQINGHTDNTGSPADNLTLSQRRAEAVVNYLTSKGIAANRLSSKGWGETRPVAPNTTEEGKAANRRTEMEIVGL